MRLLDVGSGNMTALSEAGLTFCAAMLFSISTVSPLTAARAVYGAGAGEATHLGVGRGSAY
jgi:hypothetical protein